MAVDSDPIVPRSIAIPLRFLLRSAQVAFAAIIAGLVGHFLNSYSGDGILGRWIYVEVVAAIGIIFGVVLMVPILHGYFVWPIDILFSLAWFAAFGTLINALEATVCGRDVSSLACTQWKVSVAFSFLSAIVWLVTGVVGLFYVWRADQQRLGYWTGRYRA